MKKTVQGFISLQREKYPWRFFIEKKVYTRVAYADKLTFQRSMDFWGISIYENFFQCSKWDEYKPIRVNVQRVPERYHKRVRNARTRSDLLVPNPFEDASRTCSITVRLDMG